MVTDIATIIRETAAAKQWERIGIKHHHGINLPLFALRSQKSAGIGEFTDLIPLINWCSKVGFNTIQLLPLNDTGPETSPYSAISAFALNPIHLGLADLPHVNEHPMLLTMLKDLHKLNTSQRIDYPKVHNERGYFLREYFKLTAHFFFDSPEYQSFLTQNSWLKGYALFKSLKSYGNWISWDVWPEEIKNPSESTLEHLEEKFEIDIAFHIFVQFLCFTQLKEIKKIADGAGVYLKGDIPILINRESADVWLNRSLFIVNLTAGAPPDVYNKDGQKWGFPLYNWTEMEHQNYAWWKLRLNLASNFYHIYRIDHIVGFFRIWGIPSDKKAEDGQFVPSDDKTWIPHGEKIMRMMLKDSPMLPIGEDLGIVGPEIRKCLRGLGICGTKVMRWERFWDEPGKPFIKPEEYPPESMTTVSTHDSDTLQLWWAKSPEEARDYANFRGWNYSMPLSPEYQFSILYNSHHSGSLFHINLLQEYLALFSDMVWPNPEDERINIPGLISSRNWTYRFRPTLEEIVGREPLANLLQDLIA